MFEALGVHPLAQADRAEQLDRSGLEQAGPLPRLAVGPAAVLHHDGIDAAQRQQVREQQAGRAGADDPDLSAPDVGMRAACHLTSKVNRT